MHLGGKEFILTLPAIINHQGKSEQELKARA